MKKGSTLIVQLITFSVVLFYVALIGLFGFFEDWSWLKKIMFFVLTYVIWSFPFMALFFIYKKIKQSKDEAYKAQKEELEKMKGPYKG
jgi:membrane protein YdbS with pleckstrin-like domain